MQGQDLAGGIAFDEVAEELEGVAAAEEAEGAAPLVTEQEGQGQQRHRDADHVEVEAERVLVAFQPAAEQPGAARRGDQPRRVHGSILQVR